MLHVTPALLLEKPCTFTKTWYIITKGSLQRNVYNSSFISYNNVVSRMYSTDGQSLCTMGKGIRFSFHSNLRSAQRMPYPEWALLM